MYFSAMQNLSKQISATGCLCVSCLLSYARHTVNVQMICVYFDINKVKSRLAPHINSVAGKLTYVTLKRNTLFVLFITLGFTST